MFGNKKKSQERFRLSIDKKQAEEEHREYLSQPPEVLRNLRTCRSLMWVFISSGIILSLAISGLFFGFKSPGGPAVTLGICLLSGAGSFLVTKRHLDNWRLRLVPLICLCAGWGIGTFCVQRIILIILNIAG